MRCSRLADRLPLFGWKPHIITVAGGYSLQEGGLADPLETFPNQVQRVTDPIATLVRQNDYRVTRDSYKQVFSGSLRHRMKKWVAKIIFPDRTIFWALLACLRSGKWAGKQIEVVHSSQPSASTHIIGYFLSRRLGVPWVAEFRDPLSWIPQAKDSSTLKQRVLSWLEGWIVRQADATVVVASTAQEYFSSKYPQAKVVSIPNGAIFDLSEVRHRLIARRSSTNSKYVMVHAGNLYGGARKPEPLIRAAMIASKRLTRPIELHFYGNDAHLAAEIAYRLGCVDLVKTFANVPFDQCQEAINEADVNVALLHDDPVAKVSIMSKYFDYITSGAPILLLGDPEALLSRIVEEDKVGASFDYSEVERIADWIVYALELPTKLIPASDEICLKWSAEAMSQSMSELFDELCARER
ncbi:glycosyltransferase [bacterium]|nr:glycosyltransferase [bacterium]